MFKIFNGFRFGFDGVDGVGGVDGFMCFLNKSLHIPPRFDYAELCCYDFNYFQMLLLWF